MPIPGGDADTRALFTISELTAYMQVSSLDEVTALLIRDLVTAEIRQAVGATTYDALTDLTGMKLIALVAAKRMILNPEEFRSETIDDYSYTRSSESLADPYLTDDELGRLRSIAGLSSGGAFSIRPYADVATSQADCRIQRPFLCP